MSQHKTQHIIEAALLTAGKPLSVQQLQAVLSEDDTPLDRQFVLAALDGLADDLAGRGVELRQVASGYRLQVKQEFEPWVARLFEERPPRYSRALLETLALIAYRQPITRAEIEDVRGVSVSSTIVKTLLEREWIKVVGQRDVPGRPSMYGTTKAFLDYFNIKAVSDLPPLDALLDLETIDKQLDMLGGGGEPSAESVPSVDADDMEEGDADALPASLDGGDTVSAAQGDATDPTGATSTGASVAVAGGDIGGDATEIDTDGDATEADIDGLVEMLDQLDAPGDISDDVVTLDGVDADASVGDVPVDHNPVTTPSALARSGDTVAAVEAARSALAEQAERALSDIASRQDSVDASVQETPGPADDPTLNALGTEPSLESDVPAAPPHDTDIAALIDADNRNHEAARGEPVTPADSLRRSAPDTAGD